jgi:iron complex transport system permease protein
MTGIVMRSRRASISIRLHPRAPKVIITLLVLLILAFVWDIGSGAFSISPQRVLAFLVQNGTPSEQLIIGQQRMPRALIGVLVGAALAVSGTLLQGVSSNPLAAPEIVGVSAGANLGVVLSGILIPGLSYGYVWIAAMLGAFAAIILVYSLAWNGGSSPSRLILVGIGISIAGQALVMGLVASQPVYQAGNAVVFMTGSIYGLSWKQFVPLLPAVLVLLAVTFSQSRFLDGLQMGEDVARGLGMRVARKQALLIVLCVALAGVAVAVAGPVAFVGLMAPHISRFLVGNSHAGLLPVAALVGALLVTVSDTIGRTAFAPTEVPVGIVTALVGVPYFLYLLVRGQSSERGA